MFFPMFDNHIEESWDCKINSLQDTVAVTNHMIYDFDDAEADVEVPDLEDFKEQLVGQMLRSAFFQNEIKEKIIMTKLPNIIAPGLVKKQVNSDSDKKNTV